MSYIASARPNRKKYGGIIFTEEGEEIMWKKNKQVVDERIKQESDRLSAKLCYAMAILSIISLVIKVMYGLPIIVYALEIIALVSSVAYVIFSEVRKGIFGVKEKDDALLTIHRSILSKAMNMQLTIYIFGEFLFIFLVEEYFWWGLSFMAIWFVPALVYTIAAVKNGWLIWGNKKREVEGKKNFKLRVAIGSLVYGLIMGFPELYHDGAFHAEGILWILGMASFFGILFYVVMMGMMKVAEKKADSNLKEKEREIEE